MRAASLSLILATGLATAGLATESLAQAPSTTTPGPSAPAAAQPASPAPGASATQPAQPATPSTQPAQPAAPAGAAPQGAAPPGEGAAAAAAAPSLPTTGDGAVVLEVLEKVCVPLVHNGNLDQLAQANGFKKNRRDGTWVRPLGGDKNYTITLLPSGVNKDVCQAEIHFAVGQDAPIYKAINVWAFMHRPELIQTANYVAVDADNVKRVRRSWEHQESASSIAVNFTTWRKPDDSPLNRGFDSGMLFYQERTF
jgi:hypothetical protein